MSDRKVLIGDIADGIVLHQQGDWSEGNDRLADPDGRVLALLSEIGDPGAGGGGSSLGSVHTVYVDAERTDEYTADGTFDKPFILLQDGIDALLAIGTSTTEVNAALVVSPSRQYINQTEQLIMTLPSDSVVARRLALVANSIGGANTSVVPPLRIDSPSNASINFIAMRGLSFAGVASAQTDTVLHVKGHANFTGQLRFYVSDVQFTTNTNASDNAFYVEDGGGSFGMYAVGHTNFTVKPGSTGNAILMERGWMNLSGSHIWGGAAPAVNLSGSASLTLTGGELSVSGGTNTDLVNLADTSSINLRDVFATPRGSGAVISHSGTGGFISVYDVMVDMSSTGNISAPAGAPVLLGICIHSNGTPVAISTASPAQIVRVVPGAQVAYADGSGGAWDTAAPLTTNAAIDRLATQVAAHLGGTIPE